MSKNVVNQLCKNASKRCLEIQLTNLALPPYTLQNLDSEETVGPQTRVR
jgi:hypothetical protein